MLEAVEGLIESAYDIRMRFRLVADRVVVLCTPPPLACLGETHFSRPVGGGDTLWLPRALESSESWSSLPPGQSFLRSRCHGFEHIP